MRHKTTKKSGIHLGSQSRRYNPLRTLRRGFQGLETAAKSMLWLGGVASLLYAATPTAHAAILLDETSQQGLYSAIDDPATQGFDIQCTLSWGNVSESVPANNQISASGTFGSHQGLYKITTTESPHNFLFPTYLIHEEDFWIDYADGVVNTPNSSDTFKFHFNLGAGVTNQAQAQQKADLLNAYISGAKTLSVDQAWGIKRSINGTVAGNAFPVNFENSPPAYVLPAASAWVPFYAWLDAYGLTAVYGDADGDGILNGYEYYSDTTPTNPASFPSISISGTTLAFPASTNCTYAVEWSENLSSNVWNTLTNAIPGINGTLEITNSPAIPTRYYRLQTTRQQP